MTEIVNLKHDAYDVYIGRQRQKYHYGNPFSTKSSSIAEIQVNSTEEAVSKFRDWLHGTNYQWIEPTRRKWILNNLESLRGKRLGCFVVQDCVMELFILNYLEKLTAMIWRKSFER